MLIKFDVADKDKLEPFEIEIPDYVAEEVAEQIWKQLKGYYITDKIDELEHEIEELKDEVTDHEIQRAERTLQYLRRAN